MGRTLFLQCDSGISGDMVVAALLDLGAGEKGLLDALAGLGLEGYEIRVTRKLAGALDACDFNVVMDKDHQNHDHDMEWLFGGVDELGEGDHDHGHEHNHAHDHDHEHAHHAHDHHNHAHGHHEHSHAHDHHGHHHHEHRNLADITAIVESAGLSMHVREMALRVFGIIAEAEAKAHGETVETVHFHEVGAIDSIVDVVAATWCLDDLGVDDVVVSPLAEGEGYIRCAHGVLPIPVPAVANIVEANGLVLRRVHRKGELVTPTGAALAAAMRTRDSLPDLYRIVGTGIGCGKRAYNPPSTLRVTLVEEVAEDTQTSTGIEPTLWKLETEVDDCTGEALGHVLELLYEAGAREAHFVPVFMKKNRPGYQVEVICDEELIPSLEGLLFSETTTIGVRRYPLERTALVREAAVVGTPFGDVEVKRVVLPGGTVRVYPEHESVARLARKGDTSYQDVMRAALAACGH